MTLRSPRFQTLARRLGVVLALATGGGAYAQPLTPDEALRRAAARSPELQAALSDVVAARAGVQIEDRSRDAVLTANAQGAYSESFSDTSEGATLNSTERFAADVSVRTTTSIGTQLTAGFSTSARWQTINRDPTTTAGVTLGPTIAAEVSVDVVQPLLRGGGESAVLSSLRVARSQAEQAELEQNEATSRLALDVLSAYWDLWVAEQSLTVERSGLELMLRQKGDMDTRVKLGTVAEIESLRLASEAASRRQRVTDAEATLADRQMALARLTGIPYAESSSLSTAAAPAGQPTVVGAEATITLALRQSPELARLAAGIEQSKERVRAARNAAETRLDAWANLAAGGLWTEGPPSGLELPGGRPAISALVGLTLELPLGDASADARLDQARANLRSATLRQDARIETLSLEVARLHRSLQAAKDAVRTAAETAEIAKRLAEHEEQKLKLGTSLIIDLVSAQQAGREAELTRLRAQAEAERLALQLDHLTGTLFSRIAASENRP